MGIDWIAPLATAAIVLTGMVGVAGWFRARAVKRWLATLDGYADREIARAWRQKARR
jgi:hypothetical protein